MKKIRNDGINEHIKKRVSTLFIVPILLTTIGLFFIFEASSVSAFRNLGDSFYYLKAQMIWFILGIIAMIFFSLFSYKNLYYLSLPAVAINIFLLVAVLIPGIGSKIAGARRWIDLGVVSLQPTEFIKFSLILYLSSWLVKKEKSITVAYFGLMILIIGLIMLQPDMGTTIIVTSIFMVLYIMSGNSLKPVFVLTPVGILSFFVMALTSSYRRDRFLAFLNPDSDVQGATYHIKQILISLSSGGLFGRGFNESRQKYQFLPEAHTDSIFAIIGEEIGFVGSVLLIIFLFYLMYKAFQIAKNAPDRYGVLLASGIFSLLSFQIIINLGSMVNIMPLTGIPLPFISYGGSSLIVFFALMGILINIAKHEK